MRGRRRQSSAGHEAVGEVFHPVSPPLLWATLPVTDCHPPSPPAWSYRWQTGSTLFRPHDCVQYTGYTLRTLPLPVSTLPMAVTNPPSPPT